jgi:hypothetical protein
MRGGGVFFLLAFILVLYLSEQEEKKNLNRF